MLCSVQENQHMFVLIPPKIIHAICDKQDADAHPRRHPNPRTPNHPPHHLVPAHSQCPAANPTSKRALLFQKHQQTSSQS